jgi:hypothetical protein
MIGRSASHNFIAVGAKVINSSPRRAHTIIIWVLQNLSAPGAKTGTIKIAAKDNFSRSQVLKKCLCFYGNIFILSPQKWRFLEKKLKVVVSMEAREEDVK